ncbi:MAG TPA: hypothetical protein VJ507_03110 [Candidatus Bathyarchaeia archaeon]|nr:hypothetical protein [Candidatus Bathyarchaeia archaeon]
MKIDITTLSEDELIDLHRRITERLRFLSQTRAHHRMLEFNVGDRVSFKPDDRPALRGVLTKYNKKTVTIITDNGEHWNVAPGLLTLAKDTKESESKRSNVIQMPKR